MVGRSVTAARSPGCVEVVMSVIAARAEGWSVGARSPRSPHPRVAQLHGERYLTWDDVRGTRPHVQAADRANLPARLGAHDAVHREHELGGGEQGVAPLVHGGGARVVREATNRDVVLVDADDPLHDPDLDAAAIEDPSLLDV